MGGTAAKLLVTPRTDNPGETLQVTSLVAATLADARQHDVLLVVEVLVDRLAAEGDATCQELFPQLLLHAAQAVAATGVVMLKLPYPGSAGTCAAISELGVPWAVLSAGADFATFVEQLGVAVANGCCGFVAGRTLWQDAVTLAPSERTQHLQVYGAARLRALTDQLRGATRWREYLCAPSRSAAQ